MAIRLRKVESNYRAGLPAAVDKVAARRQRLRGIVVINTLILAAAVALTVYFLHLRPVVGIALVEVDSVEVRSPVSATIDWIATQPLKPVRQGEVLCRLRIKIDEHRQFDLKSAIEEKSIALDRIDMELAEYEARYRIDAADIVGKLVDLRSIAVTAAAAYERGVNTTRLHKELFEARNKEMFLAERLLNLDALPQGDFLAASRLAAEARHNYENALLFERGQKAEMEAAAEILALHETLVDELRGAFDTIRVLLARQKERRQAEIEQTRAQIDGQSIIVEVVSPIDGILMTIGKRPLQYVRDGEALMSVYDPESVELIVYADEKFKGEISEGMAATIKFAENHPFTASVDYIRPAVAPPPPSLVRRHFLPEHAYCLVLRMEGGHIPRHLIPGEVGRAVFAE